MNIIALKYACAAKWKKANIGKPIPNVIIISPNCLNVDKAIIFFISISPIALTPAINIVLAPNIINIHKPCNPLNIKFIRISK